MDGATGEELLNYRGGLWFNNVGKRSFQEYRLRSSRGALLTDILDIDYIFL